MAGDSGAPSSLTMLRWTSLVVVAANIAFVADYSALGESPSIAEVMADYGTTVVPSGFAKTMCAAILGAFLVLYVDALWPHKPRQPRIRIYDKLVIPVALTSVLASCWVVAFRQGEVALSAALVAACAALSVGMFARVASVSPSEHSGWLRVPFSLHFGAMTLALLVTATQWLNHSGLLGGTAAIQDDVASAFMSIAVVMGGLVALRYSDFVYPAVIAVAGLATFMAQRTHNPHVAADALIMFVGMFVVVALAAVELTHEPRRPKDPASRRRARVARRAQDEGWYLVDENTSIMRF